jgi:hypothetical protein
MTTKPKTKTGETRRQERRKAGITPLQSLAIAASREMELARIKGLVR